MIFYIVAQKPPDPVCGTLHPQNCDRPTGCFVLINIKGPIPS